MNFNLLVLSVALVLVAANRSFAKQCDAGSDVNKRFDCYPEGNTNQTLCEARGCCWQEANATTNNLKINVPWCFFPSDFTSYNSSEFTSQTYGYSAKLTYSGDASLFFRPNLISTLTVEVHHFAQSNYVRVKIYDPNNNKRYQVPVQFPVDIKDEAKLDATSFPTTIENGKIVIKDKFNKTLLDTSLQAPFIYADQFIQFTTLVDSQYAYGFGEVQDVFAKPTSTWRQYSIFGVDEPPARGKNAYGTHPFGMFVRADGSSHGVFLLNSNAMDIEITPYPAVTFRTIGGIIDLFLYAGSKPSDVVSQHVKTVGLPIMPPYWALGFHLSRYGYNTIENMTTVIERNLNASMPFDVQWLDIDTFQERRDWTYDLVRFANLPDYVKYLHSKNMRVVPIVDPAIQSDTPAEYAYTQYTEGLAKDVYIRSEDGTLFIGKVWPGNTTFPDFLHPNVADWWLKCNADYKKLIDYDGLWIDMNEPANFEHGNYGRCVANNKYDYPPYIPRIIGNDVGIFFKTVCMSAKQTTGIHYDLHNLYGHLEAKVTNEILPKIIPGKRPFVLTRSTYAGTGKYAHHWTGDVGSNWDQLYLSIPDMLNFNLFGIPFVGADVCGFWGDVTEQLCVRWMQLGTFYPFMRNHNGLGHTDQDPAAWSDYSQKIMRDALHERYRLLPYFYTQHHKASAYGEAVIRPLFWNFPEDSKTHGIDKQFMLGSALLVSPVLNENDTQVNAYVPKGTWYTLSGDIVSSNGAYVTLNAPLNYLPVHIRGGHILPMQHSEVTTEDSRKNPYYLIVALDDTSSAYGDIYIDDGVSDKPKFSYIKFHAFANNTIYSSVVTSDYDPKTSNNYSSTIDKIKVYGVQQPVAAVTLDGKVISHNYDGSTKVLSVDVNANVLKAFSLQWSIVTSSAHAVKASLLWLLVLVVRAFF